MNQLRCHSSGFDLFFCSRREYVVYGEVVCVDAFAAFVGVSRSTIYNLLKLPRGNHYAEMPRRRDHTKVKQAAIWEFQVNVLHYSHTNLCHLLCVDYIFASGEYVLFH